MEFHVKLQELRKQRGLTQEELAAQLFVSRAAVSKWESGRGYPNIDSLKAMATFFGVTVDALLSGDQLLSIAEAEGTEKQQHFRSAVFGLLDCSVVMFLFLPFFGQTVNGAVQAVPLLSLTEISPYLRSAYLIFVAASSVWGILSLILRNRLHLSLAISAAGVLLFIISLQPYGAAYLFVFLIIKAFLLLKKQ